MSDVVTTYRIYGYRWVVLAGFMAINLMIQVLWICFAAITTPAMEFYRVSEMRVGMLAMVFMIVYVPAALPAAWIIDRLGFYKGVGLGAALLGVFGLLRGLIAQDYKLVFACTIGLALAQPLLLSSFTTVAAKWFPRKERATATGLCLAANFIGTIIGLALTPLLFARYGIPRAQMIYGVAAAAAAMLFLILAREQPPTPPDDGAERALMLDGLRLMLSRRDFWICMVIFFVGVGVFNGLANWIEPIVAPKGQDAERAGYLGALLLLGGVVGAAVMPIFSDRSRRRKPFILAGLVLSIPALVAFTFLTGFVPLAIALFIHGFFLLGIAPIGYQYAAEITFPAPEGTSNGLLALAGQVSVIFIFAMEAIKNATGSFTPSLLLGAGLITVNAILVALVKEAPGSLSTFRDGR